MFRTASMKCAVAVNAFKRLERNCELSLGFSKGHERFTHPISCVGKGKKNNSVVPKSLWIRDEPVVPAVISKAAQEPDCHAFSCEN